MPLPSALPKVTVTIGPLMDFMGQPLSGHVTVVAEDIVTHIASGTPIVPTPVKVPLNVTGAASITLPATDAPGLTRRDFSYLIEYHLTSKSGDYADIPPFSFRLPQSVPVVDSDLLIPVSTTDGTAVSVPGVISVGGLSGVITTQQLEQLVGGGTGGSGGGLVPGAVQTGDVIADVDDFLEVDATAGDVTVQAPDDAQTGDTFAVCKVDSTGNTVTVDFSPSTVNGDSTALIVTQWAGGTFIRNVAGAWRILSYMPGSTSTGGGGGGVTVISGGAPDSTYTLDSIDGGTPSSTYTLPGYSGGTP